MNLPNKLVVIRIALIPFFLFFLLNSQGLYGAEVLMPDTFRLIALIIFVVASITDFFDGFLARRWNMVTNFGKLMDPLADKMLVSAALIALLALGEMPVWIVLIMIFRDFFVTGLRQLALEKDKAVIAASLWGKLKTILQMTTITAMLAGVGLGLLGEPGIILVQVFLYLATAATLVSAVTYAYGYYKVTR